jgi:GNAT superfamily N-acetyltransferase
MSTEWVVEELVVPSSMDAADAADFATSVDVDNRVEAQTFGTDELRAMPDEALPWWHHPASPQSLFGVREGGALVARASAERLLSDESTLWASIAVLPSVRNRGIGSALSERLHRLAHDEGRTKLIAHAVSRDAEGARIGAPTGFGSVPAGNDEVRFLTERGFRLEQVERISRLALPIDVEVSPPADYRLHHWTDATPTEWLADLAVLHTRMSTDTPNAGLDVGEDPHTVERVLEVDAAMVASPRPHLTTAVEHVPTGRLAGFTVLSAPVQRGRAINQYSTLVLTEHRGHGLGMLLKRANIDYLQRALPGHSSIVTYNAEENRFMLDVNEAVGFVPIGYEGVWRKDL